MKRLIFFFLICFLFVSKTDAQVFKSFSEDSLSYFEEINNYMLSTRNDDRKKLAEDLMERFESIWYGGVLSDSQRKVVYKNSNALLKRRLKPFPHFYDYLNTTLVFIEKGQSVSNFLNWQESVEPIINIKRSKPLKDYNKTAISILEAGEIYVSPGFTWQVTIDSFRIVVDSVLYFEFDTTNLICRNKTDSTVIYNVSGRYNPVTNHWYGKNGRIDWSHAGWDSDSVYALFPPEYDFSLKKSNYQIDSVNFFHKQYFDEALVGTLEDKVISTAGKQYIRYPKFASYQKRLSIPGIYPEVDYEGGFRIEGYRIIGYGDFFDDAQFVFHNAGETAIKVKGNSFIIKQDLVNASNAQVSIYMDSDSIYHSGIQFKYNVEDRSILLKRKDSGATRSPFHNSFHDIDMYCEAVFMRLQDSVINFEQIKGLNSDSEATFASKGYYSQNLFNKLQGIDETHPLAMINAYHHRSGGDKSFLLEDLQDFMKISSVQIERMLIELANYGFIIYDEDNEKIFVMDKLFDYLDARGGKIDYDVISFASTTKSGTPNASFNRYTNDLFINGVPEIILSDSQQVQIYPKGAQIIMKENRDFLFSGRVHAGLFDIYGDSCSFDYNKFNLNLPLIDSVVFSVKNMDSTTMDQQEFVKVNSTIADLSGSLQIDHPNNKGGLKPSPDYPILENKNEAFVYYDQYEVHQGVYDRSRYKFHVYPFIIDSLDNFSTDGIQFEGYLESGIFPDIEKPLAIMEDYSLGFETVTPKEGYPTYQGKGRFYDSISLSNEGLLADGRFEYLTSVSISDNLIFFPDSMNSIVDTFNLHEQLGNIEYPSVEAEGVYAHWLPYSDSLMINSLTGPFEMYKAQNVHNGGLTLTPEALRGSGSSRSFLAEVQSSDFVFENMSFGADTSIVTLYSVDTNKVAATMVQFDSYIDLKSYKGNFVNNDNTLINFPTVQFVSAIDVANWDIKANSIEFFEQDTVGYVLDTLTPRFMVDANLPGADFLSLNKDHDSLHFLATNSFYDLEKNDMKVNGIERIDVADASIQPGDKSVMIHEHAIIDPVEKSMIVASRDNKSHLIENANIQILSSKKYEAKGYYSYTGDEMTEQLIYFDKIEVDTSFQTIAGATITERDDFMLNPYFQFKGNVSLMSSNPYLHFKGGYQIQHDCENIAQSWVYFESELDAQNVVLPLTRDLVDLDGNQLRSGLVSSIEDNDLYPVFVSAKHHGTDFMIFEHEGKITYDEGTREYKIASEQKLNNFNLAMPYYTFNTERCIIHGAGDVELFEDPGRVKMKGIGNLSHYLIPDSTSIRMILPMDFHFSDPALRIISDSIRLKNLPGVDIQKGDISIAFDMMLGKEAAEKYKTDISLYGSPKRIPLGLDGNMVFNDVKLYWNQATRSYISDGPIGVSSVGKVHLNKYVDGWFEIVNKKTGQELNIYLELDNDTWFYFNYANGIMQSISSNNRYNNLLLNTKEDKRILEEEEGLSAYEYIISTDEKKKSFVRKMKRFAKKSEN
jgi:hypothetical protein